MHPQQDIAIDGLTFQLIGCIMGSYNNIAHNVTIDNLLTLLHVRSDISYIEGVDGSDIDDLIELVATL